MESIFYANCVLSCAIVCYRVLSCDKLDSLTVGDVHRGNRDTHIGRSHL